MNGIKKNRRKKPQLQKQFGNKKFPSKNNLLEGMKYIDYKNVELLENFINNQGKILPRRMTRLTAFEQRQLSTAIKRARIMALLPFVKEKRRK
ncbi:MAG: 30S ribosomal protein S18 [Mycoplasma sp.]|nr:30S ribosomal protein S18 [Mycoplasma sp.]